MHPDMERYVWITVKAAGCAIAGIYVARIAIIAYEALRWEF
jgi:hypothetical protein